MDLYPNFYPEAVIYLRTSILFPSSSYLTQIFLFLCSYLWYYLAPLGIWAYVWLPQAFLTLRLGRSASAEDLMEILLTTECNLFLFFKKGFLFNINIIFFATFLTQRQKTAHLLTWNFLSLGYTQNIYSSLVQSLLWVT